MEMMYNRLGRAFAVRKLTEHEVAALDGMYRTVLLCNLVERWASGFSDHEQPYFFVERALRVALEDLFGAECASEILAEIHGSGEDPSRVIEQYFDGMLNSE